MSNKTFDIENPQYHQSHINMFLRCGKQFMYRYMEGKVIPPGAALTVGNAVDTAVTHNLSQKITSGVDVPIDEVTGVANDDFEKRAVDTDFQGTTKDREKDIAIRLTRLHHALAAPKINPQYVQWGFSVDSGRGYRLGGTADIIEKDWTVEDTKTSNKAYNADAVQNNFQPAFYSAAVQKHFGVRPKAFRYRVLIKPQVIKKESLQIISGEVTKTQENWLFETIDRVHKSIKAGVFLPALPDSWVCTKRFCGYYSICRGKA